MCNILKVLKDNYIVRVTLYTITIVLNVMFLIFPFKYPNLKYLI